MTFCTYQIIINISRDNLSAAVFERNKTSVKKLIVDRRSLLKLVLKITGFYANAFAEFYKGEYLIMNTALSGGSSFIFFKKHLLTINKGVNYSFILGSFDTSTKKSQ